MPGRDVLISLGVMLLWGLWAFSEGRLARYAGTFGYSYIYVYIMLVSAVIELPVYRYIYRHSNEVNPFNFWAFFWATVVYLSCMAASILYLVGLRSGRFTVVTAISGAYPMVSVILARMVGQQITLRGWLGICLVVGGCCLLNKA